VKDIERAEQRSVDVCDLTVALHVLELCLSLLLPLLSVASHSAMV